MRAADLIVDSLKAHGIKRVYCVPGESYLTLLDALHASGIDVIVCRHEGGAGFMAVSEAKITGKPGVVMVSRGPGATNASIAVHMAEQDAVPLLVLIGQVSREELTRNVFQEVDYSQFFGGFCKAVFQPQQGGKLYELMPRAMRLAQEGVAGPVAIALPEDILSDEISDRAAVEPYPLPMPIGTKSDIDAIQAMIDQAERPMIYAGARLRSKAGALALARAADAQRIPVATTWKNQDVFDNNSRLFAGHIGFGSSAAQRALFAQADLVLAIGTRLGDIATFHHTIPAAPLPQQRVVHVYPDGKPIGRVTRPDLAVISDPLTILDGLAASARVVSSAREAWVTKINEFRTELQTFKSINPDDGVDFGQVVVTLNQHAPADSVIVMDSGNVTTWVHRHWKFTPSNLMIGGIVGAMGLGVPGAVASCLNNPNRMAIAFVGDGSALMTGQELAVAMAYGLKPKIVISDNGIYGTIRLHQEREFPGRVSGTMLSNPDFAAWGRSFGADAFSIQLGDDVDTIVKAFLASPNAAVLHVKSSRKALSAFVTMKD